MYALAILIISVIYLPTLKLYFMGGDDFREIARAKFEDSQSLIKVFTTPHDANRYRPVDRGLNFVSYSLWGALPLPYRVRNLFFHICNSILVGYLTSQLIKSKNGFSGPIATLLFGLNPYNNLPVVLAITTKTLLGFEFLLLSLVWLRIWKLRKIGVATIVCSIILSVLIVFTHEQLILIVFFLPIIISLGLVFISTKLYKATIVWVFSTWGSVLLSLSIGRSFAGVSSSSPIFQSFSTIIKNVGICLAGLFSPLDFLLLFDSRNLSRENIFTSLLSPKTAMFVIGSLIVVGIIVIFILGALKSRPLDKLFLVLFLLLGLLFAILPVVLFSEYSELYNYIPSMFVWALFLEAIFSLDLLSVSHKARNIVLIIIILLFGWATIRRNLLLISVSSVSKTLSVEVRQLVPYPKKQAEFIFYNKPEQADGYSLYGLQGVGVFEEFGVEPFVQLAYGRSDLSAKWVKDYNTLINQCSERPNSVYIFWEAENETWHLKNCEEIRNEGQQ